MSLASFVREVLGSAVSSIFDPGPIVFRPADEAGVRPVGSACRKSPGIIREFRRPLNRNAFLCGCLDFTEHEQIEHLIVGFGHKHASTTKISSLVHVVGTEHSVSIPDAARAAIQAHAASAHNAEVLIFHNHPPNFLNAIFDSPPLPSVADRQLFLAHLVQPLVAIKTLLGGGRVRCYLGENGFVREFYTPELLNLIESLSKPKTSVGHE